jgi:nonsense-mediated mRNA decay protein 3
MATDRNGMKATEIPCCLCGTMILPNAVNQCSTCLSQEVDLRGLLQRGPGGSDHINIHQCRKCRRFARTERNFVDIELESPELMGICLKHIPALASNASPKIQVKDAIFVWTEPNSMRIKIRLTVRTEVLQAVTIQQRCVVEFIIKWSQCPDCNREYTNRTWQAMVQLRQRRHDDDAPRKGLVVLEMALARNAAVRKHVLSMDTCKQGFDFYFLSLNDAQTFSSYLSRVAPMRIKTTKKLVSTDVKSNTANLKHTVSCDMVPVCRDDLILIHKRASSHALAGRLALVTKMSSVVHLVDASPKRTMLQKSVGDLSSDTYYKSGGEKIYQVLSSSRRMTRFVVLDIELCEEDSSNHADVGDQAERKLYQGPSSGVEKYALADVMVARETDFGQNDETFSCVTHLGNLLQAGDICLGYDLVSSVISGAVEGDMEKCFNSHFTMPDVVLVKKVQGVESYNASAIKEEESEDHKALEKRKSGRAKKREKRNRREEKKLRALEEAAGRMGFLGDNNEPLTEEDFEQELVNDPELAEELRAAEQELLLANEKVGTTDGEADTEETGEVASEEEPEQQEAATIPADQ